MALAEVLLLLLLAAAEGVREVEEPEVGPLSNLGMTGSMVLPKEESCAMKYPKEVLAACSRADRWLEDSRGDWDSGSTTEEEAGGAEVEDAGEEAGVLSALAPGLLSPGLFLASSSFFCLSSSARIFLCWSTLAWEGLLKARDPGGADPDMAGKD